LATEAGSKLALPVGAPLPDWEAVVQPVRANAATATTAASLTDSLGESGIFFTLFSEVRTGY
jgi:hypothetical protein